jgi:DNA-binding Lrp family transcriptional regulator
MGLRNAPQEIQDAFRELKRKLNRPMTLHIIDGNYYVYGYSSARDQKKDKTVTKTFYLGSLSKEGKFVFKGDKTGAAIAEPETTSLSSGIKEREAIALRNLSMNGRMSMAKLAKRIGMSTTGARHFVKNLETKYEIKYFAEVDTLKLGYLRYIAFVKFEKGIPKLEEVKEAFRSDPNVIFVAMTEGSFDMIVIFCIEYDIKDPNSITTFVYGWRSKTALPKYAARWYITPLSLSIGFTIPLRKEFTTLLKNKIRDNSKGAVGKMPNQINEMEFNVLNELITEGKQNFEDIDKKYSMSKGRSNYAFYKLVKNGILERVTLTINPPDLKYNAVFINQTNNYDEFMKCRFESLKEGIVTTELGINRYALKGVSGMPDSVYYVAPIFKDDEFYKIKERLETFGGTTTENMIITKIVVGSLCYRNFDPVYTTVYKILEKNHSVPLQEKLDY